MSKAIHPRWLLIDEGQTQRNHHYHSSNGTNYRCRRNVQKAAKVVVQTMIQIEKARNTGSKNLSKLSKVIYQRLYIVKLNAKWTGINTHIIPHPHPYRFASQALFEDMNCSLLVQYQVKLEVSASLHTLDLRRNLRMDQSRFSKMTRCSFCFLYRSNPSSHIEDCNEIMQDDVQISGGPSKVKHVCEKGFNTLNPPSITKKSFAGLGSQILQYVCKN